MRIGVGYIGIGSSNGGGGAPAPTRGPELWTGAFTRDDGAWVDNGNGTYTASGVAGFLGWTTGKLTSGKVYEVTVTLARTSGGFYGPYDGAAGNQNARFASGAFTFTFTATAAALYIYSSSFVGTASAISVKEVL